MSLRIALGASVVLLSLLKAVSAQTTTWNAPVSGLWSVPGNWSSGVPFSSPATQLTFPQTTTGLYTATNDLASPFQVNSLTFNFSANGTITLAGHTLILAGSSPQIIKNGGGNAVISAPLVIASGSSASLAGTGTDKISFTGGLTVETGATFNFNGRKLTLGGLAGDGTITGFTQDVKIQAAGNWTWNGSIQGTGNKKLELIGGSHTWTADNTYVHKTELRQGASLRLLDGGRLSGTTELTLDNAGGLILDDTGSVSHNDRLPDNLVVTVKKGNSMLQLLGRNATTTTETVRQLRLDGEGAMLINVTAGISGSAELTFGHPTSAISRTKAGGTVRFDGTGSTVLNAVTLNHGILGAWATLGNDWATTTGPLGGIVVPFTAYQTDPNPSSWAATDHVLIGSVSPSTVSVNTNIRTLNIANNATVHLGPNVALTFDGGGLLSSASGTITGGTLATGLVTDGKPEFIVTVLGSSTNLTLNSSLNLTTNGVLVKSGDGRLTLTAAPLTKDVIINQGSLSFDTASGDITLGALNFKGSGSVLKSGAGSLFLNPNTKLEVTGAIDIVAGNLVINGDNKLAAPMSVAAGAVLSGNGLFGQNASVTINSGGVLSPGNSPGVMTVRGVLNFDNGGIFEVELDGNTAGIGSGFHDQLVLASGATANINGAILDATLSYTPLPTDVLVLINNQNSSGGLFGTFSGLGQDAQLTLGMWTAFISYTGDASSLSATGGNDVVLYGFAPIPEPVGLAAAGLLAGVALAVWRRRCSSSRCRRVKPDRGRLLPCVPAAD